ncbi:MAG: hypothetical protein IID14_08520 [Candidatus Marinimicrobia bacterium]|nr:hypothetical protein [Candidatus Neomarinimicrobiota bacterium]
MAYTIGFDFGTNSVRALIVNLSNGEELGTGVFTYETGDNGVILDSSDHNLARQDPEDYLRGLPIASRLALVAAQNNSVGFSSDQIIGIGVDATGSTPMPIDEQCRSLTTHNRFRENPNAYAWLWKDHTSYAEAAEITALAEQEHPEYLAKCGGTYSSEWFFSKILHCLRVDPDLCDAAYTWVEICDWIPAVLTGVTSPDQIKRGRCSAGHKAMFDTKWGGLPAQAFLSKLDSKLGELRGRLYSDTYTVDTAAGRLTEPAITNVFPIDLR